MDEQVRPEYSGSHTIRVKCNFFPKPALTFLAEGNAKEY